jgi:hypothetical protein
MNPSDQEYNDIMNQIDEEITEEDINSLVEVVTEEINPDPEPEKPRCKVCDNEFTDRDPKIKTVLLLNYDEKDNAPVYGEFYICRGCIYRISSTIDVMLQD